MKRTLVFNYSYYSLVFKWMVGPIYDNGIVNVSD